MVVVVVVVVETHLEEQTKVLDKLEFWNKHWTVDLIPRRREPKLKLLLIQTRGTR